MTYYVYIMGNERPTLYIGVTNNLIKRVFEHKNELVEGFTKQYIIHKLLYFEEHLDINQAILREKQLKKWKREWKLRLIREKNPLLKDLYESLI